MRIAMMVRGYMTAPAPSDIIYAPIELSLHIAKGLTDRGHQITFFGPHGSQIPGVNLETCGIRPLIHSQKEFGDLLQDMAKMSHYVPDLWDRKFSCEMFERAANGEFDLLHFHHPEIALSASQHYRDVPVVYTIHDPIYDWYREMFDLYPNPNQHFVSISNNQRRDAPGMHFAGTVYNGIDTDKYAFSETAEDYLLCAGRIIPEKGVREAIQIAETTNHRLLIIGPVYEDHKEYFNRYIKPHLNDKILYLGFMEQEQLVKYYQKAKAFLMPLQWEEPFGLVMIESMACGTPVIALNRGSASEVIVNGKTGFVCNHVHEMAEAIQKVGQISRKDCRRHAEQHFAIANMVDGYEQVFASIIGETQKATALNAMKKHLKTWM